VSAICAGVGAFGSLSPEALTSLILGVLVILAVSQLRGRQLVKEYLDRQRTKRLELLEEAFPDKYFENRKRLLSDYLFVGSTMGRTLSTGRPHFERMLQHGGTLRVLLPDPEDERLIEMISKMHRNDDGPERTASAIRSAITTLSSIAGQANAAGHPGTVVLRLTDLPPRVGLNILDGNEPSGSLMVQHYQFRPTSESSPIIYLERESDEPWFRHFVDEAERLWTSGREEHLE
jgi:hypothetical protein